MKTKSSTLEYEQTADPVKRSGKVYIWHSDPGHAWLEVDRAELIELGILDKISCYSYQKNDKVYLEEDRDAGIFLKARDLKNIETLTKEIFKEDTPIRGCQCFKIEAQPLPANEHPKTFKTLKEGLAYHRDTKLCGWFTAEDDTYWTLGDGEYCLSGRYNESINKTRWNFRDLTA